MGNLLLGIWHVLGRLRKSSRQGRSWFDDFASRWEAFRVGLCRSYTAFCSLRR